MKQLNLLIVDDEPMAHRVLEGHCAKIDFVTVVGNCYDGISAINEINKLEVDALLLDIQMPDLNGLELVETLQNQRAPKVIFTSSFTEYAFESFNYEFVVDYLHKPVKLVRFLKAMERLKRIIELEEGIQNQTSIENPTEIVQDFIYVKDGKVRHKLSFSDIMYMQSYGNYLKYFLTNGEMHLSRQTIGHIESLLPQHLFCRIHKSYIVNLKSVNQVIGNQVRFKETTLPIGKNYKLEFAKRIER